MARLLEDLARGKGVYSQRQLAEIQAWLDADWEACDHDRDLLTIVRRLLLTIKKAK